MPAARRFIPSTVAMHATPRCGAKTRAGGACEQPGMPNGRCRLHGGKSTGPRTAEGMARMREARTIHGRATKEAVQFRRQIAELNREARITRDLLRGQVRVPAKSLAERG